MLRKSVLEKLRIEVLEEIETALVDDLIERRDVKDAELFKAKYMEVKPEDNTLVDDILNFSDIAYEAFIEYHAARKDQKAAEAQAADDDQANDTTEEGADNE